MKVVVSDTSAISNLLAIGRIRLLENLFGTVLIPPKAPSELSVKHHETPDFVQTVEITCPRL